MSARTRRSDSAEELLDECYSVFGHQETRSLPLPVSQSVHPVAFNETRMHKAIMAGQVRGRIVVDPNA